VSATAAEVEVVTFGCRLNSFESELIRHHARSAGLADLVVVHTCAVTAEAERQARQAIRRARRERPGARIVVTGCSAQIAGGRYAAMPEVDHVVGNEEKLWPATWQALAPAGAAPRALVGDIMAVRATAGHLVEGFDGRTRAFLQVQQGCDHRCTFCIIPYGRGPSRSVPPTAVLAQARLLVAQGYRELVVTGVDLTSYGRDLPDRPTLGGLLRRLLDAVPELPRLRVSSLDPAELDPELERLIAQEPRLMPHLHLSVQAGHDLILKRMRRRHLRQDVIALTRRLAAARPDLVFGADLIAGFPTEDEAMFEATLGLVEAAELTFLHVFPAARLERFLAAEVGQRRRVLVEQGGRGRTEQFAPLRLEGGSAAPAGTIAAVEVTAVEDGHLIGRLAG
jgi:threonylcarbamoyladenosine tRNA methylthiotransferase MtaB